MYTVLNQNLRYYFFTNFETISLTNLSSSSSSAIMTSFLTIEGNHTKIYIEFYDDILIVSSTYFIGSLKNALRHSFFFWKFFSWKESPMNYLFRWWQWNIKIFEKCPVIYISIHRSLFIDCNSLTLGWGQQIFIFIVAYYL